jgi:hypothetical protein
MIIFASSRLQRNDYNKTAKNYNIPPHFWIWCFIRSTQPADLLCDNTPQLRIYITCMFFEGLSLPENEEKMIEQLHN